MQSLSCQEADFMLNDALNKIKRNAAAATASSPSTLGQPSGQHQSLLLHTNHNNHHNSVNHRHHQIKSNDKHKSKVETGSTVTVPPTVPSTSPNKALSTALPTITNKSLAPSSSKSATTTSKNSPATIKTVALSTKPIANAKSTVVITKTAVATNKPVATITKSISSPSKSAIVVTKSTISPSPTKGSSNNSILASIAERNDNTANSIHTANPSGSSSSSRRHHSSTSEKRSYSLSHSTSRKSGSSTVKKRKKSSSSSSSSHHVDRHRSHHSHYSSHQANISNHSNYSNSIQSNQSNHSTNSTNSNHSRHSNTLNSSHSSSNQYGSLGSSKSLSSVINDLPGSLSTSLSGQATAKTSETPAFSSASLTNSTTSTVSASVSARCYASASVSAFTPTTESETALESTSATDLASTSASTSMPALPISSSASTADPKIDASKSSNTVSGLRPPPTDFNIHEKLRELYLFLYLKDIQDTKTETRIKLRSRSFVLETLVAKENLNTIILNLYPGNKGYSLAFRRASPPQYKTTDGRTVRSQSSRLERDEQLMETVRWPYECSELLDAVNNEELPILFLKLFFEHAPSAFYSGCVIMEVRDYRQSFTLNACCDNFYVLLKPTNQTLFADAKILSMKEKFSSEQCVALEKELAMATSGPLCLDPNPKIGRKAIYTQFKRQMWNSPSLRRQMKKFSQVAFNRKRKTDKFSYRHGLELSDFLVRARQQQRQLPKNPEQEFSGKRFPRDPVEVVKPIVSPSFDLPDDLTTPSVVDVEKFAKSFERTRESKDCSPQLIEEYVLETDRSNGRVFHIKLSILQRPANAEYLGRLYIDRDFDRNKNNSEVCQFVLGTRRNANKYIQQFTEIFTEEGRKSVKITHKVPGHPTRVSCTIGLIEYRQQPLTTNPTKISSAMATAGSDLQAQALLSTPASASEQMVQLTIQTSTVAMPMASTSTAVLAPMPTITPPPSAGSTTASTPGQSPRTSSSPNQTTPSKQSQASAQIQLQQTQAPSKPQIVQKQQTLVTAAPASNVPRIAAAAAAAANLKHQQMQQQKSQQAQQHRQQQSSIVPTSINAQAQAQPQKATVLSTTPTGTIIGITNIKPNQAQTIQLQKQVIINTCDTGINKTMSSASIQQMSSAAHASQGGTMQDISSAQTQAHLGIANGSLVVVQEQPGGGIAGVATISPQQHQQFQQVVAAAAQQQQQQQQSQQQQQQTALSAMGNVQVTNAINQQATLGNITTVNVRNAGIPVLAKLQATPQGQTHLINKSTTVHNNSEINAIMNSLINSSNQLQHQQSGLSQNHKANNNAAIISLLNSAPAAMTNTQMNATVLSTSTVGTQPGQMTTNTVSDTKSLLQTSHQPSLLPKPTILNSQQAAALQQNILQGTVRKINVQNVLNSALVGIQTQSAAQAQQQMQSKQHIKPAQQSPQQLQAQSQQIQTALVTTAGTTQPINVRVTMSALANQLSSPPAMMSSSPINPQNFNFTQLKTVGQQHPQQIILSGTPVVTTPNRLINQSALRRDSIMPVPSPGSDSNTSSTSSTMSNTNSYAINTGFNTFIATSPTASILGDGSSLNNQNSSTLIDRLTSNSGQMVHQTISGSPLGAVPASLSSTTSWAQSPKGNSMSGGNVTSINQQQTIQHNVQSPIVVQSPISISPMSSPPPGIVQQPVASQAMQQPQQIHHQATTLNLQGINLSSLQGAMASFPGLQNVQVQIPGLAQPISLSLTGSAGTSTHQTSGLLVSMPVTSANQLNQAHTLTNALPVSNVIGKTTQTVVLTTASQPGQAGSVISLPLTQLMATNVKALTHSQQSQIRAGQTMNTVSNLTATSLGINVNLTNVQNSQSMHQQTRPRSVPIVSTAAINTKNLAARGIITTQRNIVSAANASQLKASATQMKANVAQLKTNSPMTVTPVSYTTGNPPIMLTTQKIQVQLQKQPTDQQSIKNTNPKSPTPTLLVGGQTSMSPPPTTPTIQTPLNPPSSTEKVATTDTVLLGTNTNTLMNAVTIALQKKKPRRSTVSDINK